MYRQKATAERSSSLLIQEKHGSTKEMPSPLPGTGDSRNRHRGRPRKGGTAMGTGRGRHRGRRLSQKGLYRKTIDLLKAPALKSADGNGNVEKLSQNVERRDIVALARGYCKVLAIQENRKAEGERMKKWADASWSNRRLSLAEALYVSESSSKVLVVDSRISRFL